MRRAIFYKNLFLLIGAFTLFFTIVFFSIISYQEQNQKFLMESILSEVETSYLNNENELDVFVDNYQTTSNRRITILDSSGFVIADSHDEEIGTDKSLRPEIINLGKVYTRKSETVGLNLLYIATQVPDGNYLRVSILVDSQSKIYSNLTITFILSSIFWVVIYYFGVLKINQNLLKPWYQVKEKISDIKKGTYHMVPLMSPYEEINEIMHEINDINYETAQYIYQIKSYQTQLDKVLNEIKQSVLLFNQKGYLIYFNQDAKKELNLTEDALMKPLYYQIRSSEIKDAVQEVLSKRENKYFDIKLDGRLFEVKIFYISVNPKLESDTAILALIKDVTTDRKVDQMKRDFFAHASHELKSPLTAIKGHAELISNQMLKKDEIIDSANRIALQATMMTALVEDMLMLSRLENLSDETYQIVNLKHTVLDAIDQLSTISNQKQIEVKHQLEDIEFSCDEIDMNKLFKNLIENAIKYSNPNSKIQVYLKKENQAFKFIVEDQGIGIPNEHQQKVFERFYRVDKGRLDGGTGLGLAIVKHVVIKYKGTIDLKSKPNIGTTVTVVIHKD